MKPILETTYPMSWEDCMARAMRHQQKQHYVEASIDLNNALIQSQTHPLPYWAASMTYLRLATLAADRQDLADARVCGTLAHELITKEQALSLDTATCFWGELLAGASRYAEQGFLVRVAEKTFQIQSLHLGLTHPVTISTVKTYVTHLSASGQLEAAIDFLSGMSEQAASRIGNYHHAMTPLWLLRSQLALRRGDYYQATLFVQCAAMSAPSDSADLEVVMHEIRGQQLAIACAQGDWPLAHSIRTRMALSMLNPRP